MSVEFIGFITNNNSSETIVRTGPVLDPPYIETVAKAHELAGFDRALLAFHSTTPDALQVAQHVLGMTKKLNMMIAQRPGFTAPTLLARQLATHRPVLTSGRVSLHVITGGNATELRADGNTLDDKDERYARTSEFLDIVRLEWTSEKPFDYDGKYYQGREGLFAGEAVSPRRHLHPSSAAAPMPRSRSPAKHADTFALWGESYAQVRDVTARVRVAAAKYGRPCAALQPVGAADPGRHRGEGVGQGRRDPRTRRRLAGQDRLSQAGGWSRDCRRQAAARACRAGHAHRQAAVDRDRKIDRRQQQHHGTGRHAASRSPKSLVTITTSASAIFSFAVLIL